MTTTSYKLDSNLFLVRQAVSSTTAAAYPADQETNHLVIVDRSGSMSGELERIATHIKAKLPTLVRDGDTLSIVVFSSRGDCQRVITAEPVSTLADLVEVHSQIDKFFRVNGMTGFLQPIQAISDVVATCAQKNSNPLSVIFMSDGGENQSPRADVLKAVSESAALIAAATVVSYGFYSDIPFLTQMAEKWGGSLILSDRFSKFTPVLDNALQKRVVGTGKKIILSHESFLPPVFKTVFSLDETDILTYDLDEDGDFHVADGTKEVFYLSSEVVGKLVRGNIGTTIKNFSKGNAAYKARHDGIISAVYAAISLFAIRMKPEIVLQLLKATGDVRFIEYFAGLFGRQKYSEFQEEAKKAAFDASLRLVNGWDPTRIPRDDAFTVMDFLRLLQSDEDNKVLLNHPDFSYDRIGRKRVDANLRLTKEESAELANLTTGMAGLKDIADIKKAVARIEELSHKPEPLKFVENENKEGYSVRNLVFNEDRPNVSILVKKEGTVALQARMDGYRIEDLGGMIPATFETFIFRNYAIVKDGLVNVGKLPCALTKQSLSQLDAAYQEGRLSFQAFTFGTSVDGIDNLVMDLSKLPILNRQQVKAVSAEALFRLHYRLTKARAAQKVYKALLAELPGAGGAGSKSLNFAAKYGPEGAAWLAQQGFTDYSGFAPKQLTTEPTDVYMAKVLEIKLKGYSTLPSMTEYRKQVAGSKLNGPGRLMNEAVQAYEAQGSPPDPRTHLEALLYQAEREVRSCLFDVAQMKTSIIVGQTWFTEFSDLSQNTMTLVIDGQTLEFTADLKEVEEKI